MSDFTVNPNGMLDVGDELEVVTRDITRAIEELEQQVKKFVEANSGEAVTAYAGAQQKWHQGITEMNAALGAARSQLNTIHDRYRLADNRGAALFDGQV